jgi:hypothetical protein
VNNRTINRTDPGIYETRIAQDSKKGVVIACLLYFVFIAIGGGGMNVPNLMSTLAQTLRHHTDKILDEFSIGSGER